MKKKEKDPYFVGTASMSIEIDRGDKSENNVSWNDDEIRPSLVASKILIKEIKIDYEEPLWV